MYNWLDERAELWKLKVEEEVSCLLMKTGQRSQKRGKQGLRRGKMKIQGGRVAR